jgi:uncharacterized protein YbcI
MDQADLERQFSREVIRFEKEFMGRGPVDCRTYFLDDLILVRLKDVMTPAEHHLAKQASRERGRDLIKQVRQELLEHGRPLLESIAQSLLKREVLSLHTDISTKTGERIIVMTLKPGASSLAL